MTEGSDVFSLRGRIVEAVEMPSGTGSSEESERQSRVEPEGGDQAAELQTRREATAEAPGVSRSGGSGPLNQPGIGVSNRKSEACECPYENKYSMLFSSCGFSSKMGRR
jgi:hypothetical protein